MGERQHWAPALRHAAAWAGALALAVSVASFAPEAAFGWALAGGGAGGGREWLRLYSATAPLLCEAVRMRVASGATAPSRAYLATRSRGGS